MSGYMKKQRGNYLFSQWTITHFDFAPMNYQLWHPTPMNYHFVSKTPLPSVKDVNSNGQSENAL